MKAQVELVPTSLAPKTIQQRTNSKKGYNAQMGLMLAVRMIVAILVLYHKQFWVR